MLRHTYTHTHTETTTSPRPLQAIVSSHPIRPSRNKIISRLFDCLKVTISQATPSQTSNMCNIVVTTYFCGCYAGTSRERCNRRRCTVRHYTDQLAYRCYNHSRRYRSSGYDGLGSMEGAVAESDSDDGEFVQLLIYILPVAFTYSVYVNYAFGLSSN